MSCPSSTRESTLDLLSEKEKEPRGQKKTPEATRTRKEEKTMINSGELSAAKDDLRPQNGPLTEGALFPASLIKTNITVGGTSCKFQIKENAQPGTARLPAKKNQTI